MRTVGAGAWAGEAGVPVVGALWNRKTGRGVGLNRWLFACSKQGRFLLRLCPRQVQGSSLQVLRGNRLTRLFACSPQLQDSRASFHAHIPDGCGCAAASGSAEQVARTRSGQRNGARGFLGGAIVAALLRRLRAEAACCMRGMLLMWCRGRNRCVLCLLVAALNRPQPTVHLTTCSFCVHLRKELTTLQ